LGVVAVAVSFEVLPRKDEKALAVLEALDEVTGGVAVSGLLPNNEDDEGDCAGGVKVKLLLSDLEPNPPNPPNPPNFGAAAGVS
jgi:hypothetical protein